MQKKTVNIKANLRPGFLVVLSFVMVNLAFSATFNSGGGKKKESGKSGLSKYNLKSTLSFRNGYHFKGGLNFSSAGSSYAPILQHNSLRFQKGNNLYILPYKQKAFFHKFKTPQKDLK